MQSELLPRLATPFCSGMARSGGLCGAVSGGMMAIGLAVGRTEPCDDNEPSYQMGGEFLRRFTERFGSSSCRELTGVNLGTAQGQAEFKAGNQMEKCTEYVSEAVRLVMEMI